MTEGNGFTWDPELYSRFEDHRLRPALDLFSRIEHLAPRIVYEHGTGEGRMARLMADRWPDARIIAADTSPEMLAVAAATPSRVEWRSQDVSTWVADDPVDVIFSNAVLHWVDDHESLFPRLVGQLTPGGVLAVQMPMSWYETHMDLARHTLRDIDGPPELVQRMERRPVLTADEYYELLSPITSMVDLWEVRYTQVLHGDAPVFEWGSGTALRPVLGALGDVTRQAFVDLYKRRLAAAYPRRATGETLFPFRRLFLVATR